MNKQIDACFDRVEKALGTLIDSIAKYNPSTNQARELGNADAELTSGLKDLQTHQSNYQRIQDLRASTARYDAQIRDTLRLLANTRRELVHASATAFPDGPSHEIRYDELLSYARRISKTTIPPVGAANAITAATAAADAAAASASAAETTAATTPNGTSTNANTPQPQGPSDPTPAAMTTTTTTTGLPEPLATFLNPHSAYTFVPWPSEEQVRRGAVASLAYMAEQGIEAEGYDPEAERARRDREDEDRRLLLAEDRARADRDDRERRRREEQQQQQQQQQRAARRDRERDEAASASAATATATDAADSWRRASVSVGAGAAPPGGAAAAGAGAPAQPQPQPKAQFQFMGDDDDDDDD
ncbi:putative mediator of RNA polymerase II transcription subunit 4 [Rosellinia necatrix]|uniref:Mediator of RNA polymerase II transcription subunit 4 n=1 Tax=Rosellinia necatrix TaxID=77044 RepID=A0A1W2TE23_ROSNE|nr:putative mediator of RNA polymerase II transcription subunit 4 [Rosellinia necatrix]